MLNLVSLEEGLQESRRQEEANTFKSLLAIEPCVQTTGSIRGLLYLRENSAKRGSIYYKIDC